MAEGDSGASSWPEYAWYGMSFGRAGLTIEEARKTEGDRGLVGAGVEVTTDNDASSGAAAAPTEPGNHHDWCSVSGTSAYCTIHHNA